MMVDSVAEDNDQMDALSQFLKPAHFYRDENGWVWEAMLHLYQQEKPTDQIAVCQELSRMAKLEGVGGAGYLSSLIDRLPTSLHAIHYGQLVKRLAICRRIIGAAGDIAKTGYDANGDSPEATLAKAQGYLEVIWGELAADPLVITNLKKTGKETPMYYVDVNGQTIKVAAEDLLSYKRFRAKIVQLCDFVPPNMKEEEWLIRVNRLLRNVVKDPGPAEVGPEHNIWIGARNLLVELMPVESLEEFQAGRPLDKGGFLYIKGAPFFASARQRLKMINLQPTLFWTIMKDHGAKDTTTRIGGKTEGCWRIAKDCLEEKPGMGDEPEEPRFLL